MTAVPVVLVAFNRPGPTRRTFDAIRRARPEQLFLLADGPRADRPADVELCARVREILTDVDWPCTVHPLLRDDNAGCEGNVELGLDWVFAQVDRAIVLEDDCVPDPTFFRYAEELLHRYAEDRRVWQVAGNSHGVPKELFGPDSYRFSGWASVWGWATWADRWQRHRQVFPRDHVRTAAGSGLEPVRTVPAAPRPGLLVTRGGRRHFADAARSQDVVVHGWDKHWWLTMLTEGGLAATPARNLVENVGFGPEATHGVVERDLDPAEPMAFPLRHPETIEVDVEVERELELILNRVGGRAARTARKLVRSPRARRVLRTMADSDAMVRLVRFGSRLADRRTAISPDHRA